MLDDVNRLSFPPGTADEIDGVLGRKLRKHMTSKFIDSGISVPVPIAALVKAKQAFLPGKWPLSSF